MLRCPRANVAPRTPSVWIFGEGDGIQVWSVEGDERVWASVLLHPVSPVVLLNHQIVGTRAEHGALDWALARIARAEPGFYVLRAGL
jgi:hypothetical protein